MRSLASAQIAVMSLLLYTPRFRREMVLLTRGDGLCHLVIHVSAASSSLSYRCDRAVQSETSNLCCIEARSGCVGAWREGQVRPIKRYHQPRTATPSTTSLPVFPIKPVHSSCRGNAFTAYCSVPTVRSRCNTSALPSGFFEHVEAIQFGGVGDDTTVQP